MDTIEVSTEVKQFIESLHQEFGDTHESILRRILGIDEGGFRAPHGKSTQRSIYCQLIVQVLQENGGSCPREKIFKAISSKLKLKRIDLELTKTNRVRWKHNIDWAKYLLVEDGVIAPVDVPGIWKLTEAK